MLLRTVLRLSSATRVLPFLIGFVVIALGDNLTQWVTPRYWLSVSGSASLALTFVGPACAGAGAWEGSRIRRARIFEQSTVRSPLAIAFPLLLPVWGMGLIGMTAALTVSAAAAGVGIGMPNPGILTVEAVMLAANTLVGYLLGRLLPPTAAVPSTLITSFFVNAYPASWSVLWIRHLVGGALSDCCTLDQSLDPAAVLSAIVFGLAVCLAAAVLIHHSKSLLALAAALVLLTGGFALGAACARDMGAEPVVSRSTSALVCDAGRPRICLWPEMNHQAAMIRTEGHKAVDKLRQAGVKVPATLTMADRPGRDEAKLAIGADTSVADVRTGVAAGLIPPFPKCAENGEPYPAADAYGPIAAWLSLTAGASSHTLMNRVAPPELALAQHVLKQPQQVQLAWYERNAQAMRSCNARPPLGIKRSHT
ncbi:hypothetical protein B7755_043980 [Streptomyces sp. NBS 14/10]|uniref:DUF7224 domain-containing protein n=1 Tax=Streptomyces sp. NBS 14/10 TaxID=1945643 RepID=UPI000B7D24B3|nr:hypothetical protein [Streptomyces sp. NBS 14/10]KAK1184450.1 hypothetical protein B7755_043980 [Streptomyces sp. NBS 14/10]